MKNNEISECYKRTCEFIYQQASKRVRDRRNEMNLRAKDIFESDPKMISRIENARRGVNNEYLIPPRVALSLVENLKFTDDTEVYWGSDSEFDLYIEELFVALCLDILEGNRIDVKNALHDLLLDYIPYAKCFALREICSSSQIDMHWLLNEKEEELDEKFYRAREESIMRLYRQCFEELGKMSCDECREKHFGFSCGKHITINYPFGGNFVCGQQSGAENTFGTFFQIIFKQLTLDYGDYHVENVNKGFYKLPQRISRVVENEILPTMREIKPSRSLGKRVYTLISEDIRLVAPLFEWARDGTNVSKAETWEKHLETIEENPMATVRATLLASTLKYADRLERIQVKMDKIIEVQKCV